MSEFRYRETCSCGAVVEFGREPTLAAITKWREEHRHEVPVTVLPTPVPQYPWQQPLITYTDSPPMWQGPTSGVMDADARLAHEAQGRLEAAQDVQGIPGRAFAEFPDIAWIPRMEAVKVARGAQT